MKRILVTGASSGIGTGVVEVLVEAGWEVHGLARRRARLEAVSDRTGCKIHVADVRDYAAIEGIIEKVSPDALVLNAGLGGGFAGIAATPADMIDEVVATNLTATLQMLRIALPGMRDRGRGHIVTMGSVAALYPSVSALYGSTKAAVGMIAQNLRLELEGSGLRVTDIRPGRVDSEFYDTAMPDADAARAAKATGIRELSPRDVGEAVRFALAAPWHVNVSAIEIQPLEQTYGGMAFVPANRPDGSETDAGN